MGVPDAIDVADDEAPDESKTRQVTFHEISTPRNSISTPRAGDEVDTQQSRGLPMASTVSAKSEWWQDETAHVNEVDSPSNESKGKGKKGKGAAEAETTLEGEIPVEGEGKGKKKGKVPVTT